MNKNAGERERGKTGMEKQGKVRNFFYGEKRRRNRIIREAVNRIGEKARKKEKGR